MDKLYVDSEPLKISNDYFRLYQHCIIDETLIEKNTGIMVEDGCFEFMFVKEKNIKLQIRNTGPIDLSSCFSLGKLPMPYRFICPSKLTLFTIKVQPWVSTFFFSSNNYLVLDLKEKYGEKMESLHEKIFSSSSFKEMINHVELFFKSEKMPTAEEYIISKNICEQIYKTKGNIKIRDLLNQFPYSRQKINKIFLAQTKNSIKEFAIFVRIREIIKHKIQFPNKSLTTIALDYGYFDQSHFIKDMKKATGTSPSKFLLSDNLFSEQLRLYA